jgi:hypothetical protein
VFFTFRSLVYTEVYTSIYTYTYIYIYIYIHGRYVAPLDGHPQSGTLAAAACRQLAVYMTNYLFNIPNVWKVVGMRFAISPCRGCRTVVPGTVVATAVAVAVALAAAASVAVGPAE